MDIVLNNLIKVALKIAKFLNREILSPKSGSSSLAASGSLSEQLSHCVPVHAGPGPGAAPGPAGAAEVTDTIRDPDAAAAAVGRPPRRALHFLLRPGPLGLLPPAARSRPRPLLPVSGRRRGGSGTGTVVRRAPACPGPT